VDGIGTVLPKAVPLIISINHSAEFAKIYSWLEPKVEMEAEFLYFKSTSCCIHMMHSDQVAFPEKGKL